MKTHDDTRCAPSNVSTWPARLPGERDGAFARRAIDCRPLPAYLSDCPELCFDTKPDTLWVDIECLHGRDPVLPDATFWHNAAKRLEAACAGIIGRRGPLRVVPQQGGTWLVLDGNATLEAARHYGWKRLPVLEQPAE